MSSLDTDTYLASQKDIWPQKYIVCASYLETGCCSFMWTPRHQLPWIYSESGC